MSGMLLLLLAVAVAAGYLSIVSVWSASVAGANTGWVNYCLRQILSQVDLINVSGRSPTQVRITLKGASSNPALLDNVFIGSAGTAPNFTGNQVQVTFSGANSVQLVASTNTASDWIPFSILSGNDYIVSIGVNNSTASSSIVGGMSNSYVWYKAAASGEAGTTSVTGYTNYSPQAVMVSLVETR